MSILLAMAMAASPSLAPSPADDRPTDGPAAPSRACSPSGRSCAEVVGDGLMVDGVRRLTVPEGSNRLALSDDGWLAFVAPRGGWPSLQVLDPSGGLHVLTNQRVVRTPGRRPPGFVPPPVREGDLSFTGGSLSYTLPDGERVVVALPEVSE